jgi:hypothetical protein
MKQKLIEGWQGKYGMHLRSSKFVASFILSVVLLSMSLVVNFYAGEYATRYESNSVTDLILSHTRSYDLDGVFVYGSLVLVLCIVLACVTNPQKIPFVLKSIALFIIVRSVFICLTHIGPFPVRAIIDPESWINKFTFGGDLFFSGHTGLPFLMALIFWNSRRVRILFLATSVLFAVVVLLAHLHYSIDVLGAFFITYSIFHLCQVLFKVDWMYGKSGVFEP